MEAVNESPTAAKLIPNTTTYTQPNSTEVSDHVLERTSSLRERSRTTDASSEEVGLSTETSSTGLKMEMALRPLTCTQRAVGMLLFPSVSGKKWNWRNIYPYGVLAYAWISFCRLFVLHIDPKPFGGLLFVDIMWHVIGSQTALGLTVFLFLFSPNLQRFCSKWDDYKRDHGGIPYLRVRSFCRRAVIFSLVSSTITFCTCTVSSALFGGHRMIDAIAKANLAPWCQDTCPRGLIGVSTLLGFIYTFPWSMMQVTICVLSHLLTQEFSELTVTLKKEYEANNESLPNVERNRRGHNMLCKLVHMLDDMLSVYILIIVGCYVPILVFLLYCIVYYTEYQNPNAFLLVSLALLIVMFAVLLMTIIMSAAAIHMAVSTRGLIHSAPYTPIPPDIHLYTSSHTPIYLLTYTPIYTSSHIHLYTSSHTPIYLLTYTYIPPHIHLYTSSHTPIYLLTYTYIHLTYTYIPPHIYAYIPPHIHLYTSSHTPIYLLTHTYIPPHIHLYTSSHTPIYLLTHLYTSSHTPIYLLTHLYTSSCTPIYLLTYTYVPPHIYTYIPPHIHLYIPPHIHLYIPPHIHLYTSSHTPMYLLTYTPIYLLTYTYIPPHIHLYTSSHTPIYLLTYTYIPPHIHLYIPPHMYTYIPPHIHLCTSSYTPIYLLTYTYIPPHIHTYIPPHIHLYIPPHIHLYTSSQTPIYLITYTPIYLLTYTYIYLLICTPIYLTYTYVPPHIHLYTSHTPIYLLTYTPIYLITYTYIPPHIHLYTSSRAPIYLLTYTYIPPHIYTYIPHHIHLYTSSHIHLYIPPHIHLYTSSHTPMYLLTYTYIPPHIHLYTSPHTPMYLLTYTYIPHHVHLYFLTYTYIPHHVHLYFLTYTYIPPHIHLCTCSHTPIYNLFPSVAGCILKESVVFWTWPQWCFKHTLIPIFLGERLKYQSDTGRVWWLDLLSMWTFQAIEPRRIIFDLSISGAEEPGRCLQVGPSLPMTLTRSGGCMLTPFGGHTSMVWFIGV